MKKKIIVVKGRVQGVGFRYVTKQLADELEIKGTVANQDDGSVYIEAQGSDEQMKHFITKLKNNPTPFSKVETIDITDSENLDKFISFKITN
jgi:acylphosphatase